MRFLKNLQSRQKLIKAFNNAGIFKTVGSDERKIYPKIHQVPDGKYDYYVFTLPNGVDPKLMKKKF